MEGKTGHNFGSNMLLVHSSITRSLELTRQKCLEFTRPDGEPDQSTLDSFVLYVKTMEMVINAHHSGEDEIIFPRLKITLTQVPYDELHVEHQNIDVVLKKLGQLLTALDKDFLTQLLDTVTRLTELWLPHIAKEKKYLYSPEITAAFMSIDEQIKLLQDTSAHALAQGNPALMMPFVMGNLNSKDRASFSSFLPPEIVQELVPKVWKPQWAPMIPFLLTSV